MIEVLNGYVATACSNRKAYSNTIFNLSIEARLKGVKLQILHYTTMVLVFSLVYFPPYFLNYYRILHRCLPPYKLE